MGNHIDIKNEARDAGVGNPSGNWGNGGGWGGGYGFGGGCGPFGFGGAGLGYGVGGFDAATYFLSQQIHRNEIATVTAGAASVLATVTQSAQVQRDVAATAAQTQRDIAASVLASAAQAASIRELILAQTHGLQVGSERGFAAQGLASQAGFAAQTQLAAALASQQSALTAGLASNQAALSRELGCKDEQCCDKILAGLQTVLNSIATLSGQEAVSGSQTRVDVARVGLGLTPPVVVPYPA